MVPILIGSMFPKQADIFVHGIHQKISPNHEVWRMWHEHLNHNAIQHQHIVQRIPTLSHTGAHAMTLFCQVDAPLATIKLKGSEDIALRSKIQDGFRNKNKFFDILK